MGINCIKIEKNIQKKLYKNEKIKRVYIKLYQKDTNVIIIEINKQYLTKY